MNKDACWVGQQSTVLFDLMISVITVDLFDSLHVRQNHTTCASVKGLSRLTYTVFPSLDSFVETYLLWVNYLIQCLSNFGFFSQKLTCSGSTTLTRAGRPRPRYMQHIAETSWWHLILDKDWKIIKPFYQEVCAPCQWKQNPRLWPTGSPPRQPRKVTETEKWKDNDACDVNGVFVKKMWMFVKLRECLWS